MRSLLARTRACSAWQSTKCSSKSGGLARREPGREHGTNSSREESPRSWTGTHFDLSRVPLRNSPSEQTAAPNSAPLPLGGVAEGQEEELTKVGGDSDTSAPAAPSSAGGLQAVLATPSSSPKELPCGGYKWKINWSLLAPSPKGGWLIQRYDEVKSSKKCDGSDDTACNNQGGMSGGKITYWEAWKVDPGKTAPSPSDDNFNDPGCGTGTKGTDFIFGVAQFYEDLTLPSDFKPNNPATFAGSLPSTTKDPKLSGGSVPFLHFLGVSWDCCPDTSTKSKVLFNSP